MSQRVLDSLEAVRPELEPDSSVFLVTGRDSYENSGAKAIMDVVLDGMNVQQFNDFSTNPKIEDVVRGVNKYKASDSEVIIAVGGGSVIDVAKSVYILSSQSSNDYVNVVIEDNAKDELQGRFIAVPTTAGTGSESTHFAVVYVNGTKFSLAHPQAVADTAVLDPRMTESLPPRITAATGMDAIAQATEAFWSVNSTEESRNFSREALKVLLPALKVAVLNPDASSRSAMLHGANLAGRAINIAKTTACHAVSYPITSKFGIPHGHAVALTLPSFIEYNSDVTEISTQDDRGADFVQIRMNELLEMFGADSPLKAKEILEELMDAIGLERRFSALGVDEKGIDYIVKNGFNPQRVKNNPRHLSESQLREILKKI